jgi:hypothetical protein
MHTFGIQARAPTSQSTRPPATAIPTIAHETPLVVHSDGLSLVLIESQNRLALEPISSSGNAHSAIGVLQAQRGLDCYAHLRDAIRSPATGENAGQMALFGRS